MKLNDTHLILLTTASQRSDGSLVPLPEQLGATRDNVQKAIAALLRAGLAEEGEVPDSAAAWRQDGDDYFGVRVTQTGLEALGLGPEDSSQSAAQEHRGELSRKTKAGEVLSLLQRPGGAVLDDLIAATGWQPHTVRAALTGLRKKGLKIERAKRGPISCWFIKAA